LSENAFKILPKRRVEDLCLKFDSLSPFPQFLRQKEKNLLETLFFVAWNLILKSHRLMGKENLTQWIFVNRRINNIFDQPDNRKKKIFVV